MAAVSRVQKGFLLLIVSPSVMVKRSDFFQQYAGSTTVVCTMRFIDGIRNMGARLLWQFATLTLAQRSVFHTSTAGLHTKRAPRPHHDVVGVSLSVRSLCNARFRDEATIEHAEYDRGRLPRNPYRPMGN